MKLNTTFLFRIAIVSATAGLAFSAARAQDVSGHETVDNPHLRRTTPTPAASAAAQTKLSQKDQKFLSQVAAGGVQEVADAEVASKQGNENTKKIASQIASERGANNKELMAGEEEGRRSWNR